jgi:alpha-ketoglutarate-dependent taurine dioxygenase
VGYITNILWRQQVHDRIIVTTGDLLMWDDCTIQHYAVPDYKLPQRRRIHRATVDGSQPY